ncbi:hypothetical protein BU15DRAFT_68564 [Melanogaster broomeanus]|nr:hypothetical protein BU15DRAFT_68564 [Melanogaster broomeanus]
MVLFAMRFTKIEIHRAPITNQDLEDLRSALILRYSQSLIDEARYEPRQQIYVASRATELSIKGDDTSTYPDSPTAEDSGGPTPFPRLQTTRDLIQCQTELLSSAEMSGLLIELEIQYADRRLELMIARDFEGGRDVLRHTLHSYASVRAGTVAFEIRGRLSSIRNRVHALALVDPGALWLQRSTNGYTNVNVNRSKTVIGFQIVLAYCNAYMPYVISSKIMRLTVTMPSLWWTAGLDDDWGSRRRSRYSTTRCTELRKA